MFDRTITIGAIAAALPAAMEYFKTIGVDYCCGGFRKLSDVLQEKGIPADEVFSRLEPLEREAATQKGRKDFRKMSTKELCSYIVDVHHAYLRKTLPQISDLMSAVMRAHGAAHPELFQVGSLFGALRGDLEQHLIKEELFLFPALQQADGTKQPAELTPEIIAEHEHAGNLLEQLSAVTGGYQVPDDACTTYEKAYGLLAEMEEDLHRHIHLENNILFKEYDVR